MDRPHPKTTDPFHRENERAVAEARASDEIEPRAIEVAYDPSGGLVLVSLQGEFAFGFPPARIPGLEEATATELASVRISPSGDGLHWDDLDVDVSLTGLVTEALNLQAWAPRIMGQIRSEAKARAARKNGLKGGRPRRSGGKAGTEG